MRQCKHLTAATNAVLESFESNFLPLPLYFSHTGISCCLPPARFPSVASIVGIFILHFLYFSIHANKFANAASGGRRNGKQEYLQINLRFIECFIKVRPIRAMKEKYVENTHVLVPEHLEGKLNTKETSRDHYSRGFVPVDAKTQ